MRLLDCTLPTLPENLALDEVLLEMHDAGDAPELLRLWQWPTYAVVLGANGRIGIDVEEMVCEIDAVPLARRSSGGGTVLLGPGCMLFSLVLSFDRHPDLRDVNRSYRWILGKLGEALGPHVEASGISDLSIGMMKFSGNAQHRKSGCLLHHGTLLYDFDLSKIARYLKRPEREPEYRQGRPHSEFVRNLGCDVGELKSRLCATWEAGEVWDDWSRERVAELVAEEYGTMEWIRRR